MAIYMSPWYEWDGIRKKNMLFVITMAQRQKYLKAGGLFNVNVDAFGTVSTFAKISII